MMTAPIYSGLVASYAKAIYLDGTKTFADIRQEYVPYVKQYAATGTVNGTPYPPSFTGYTVAQIDNALALGYISQEEYQQTIDLKV